MAMGISVQRNVKNVSARIENGSEIPQVLADAPVARELQRHAGGSP